MTLVFGHHSVAAVLSRDPGRVRTFYVQRGRQDARTGELIEIARAAGIPVSPVERRWLEQRVDGSHQGVALDCHALAPATESELEARWSSFGPAPLLLILDGITDARNFGACLRSAAAAGVDAVLWPKRGSAPLNELAHKTAAGGAEALLLVEVSNLARRMTWLARQGVWLYGADEQAQQRWSDVDLSGPLALVLGGEEKGLRSLTRRHCDALLGIPMRGGVGSLNVSVAAGVLLFEAVRQRGLGSDGAPGDGVPRDGVPREGVPKLPG